MPRSISISVKPENTDELIAKLSGMEGVVSIQTHRNASVKPPGDMVVMLVTNSHIFEVMRRLGDDTPRPESLTISEPDAAYSSSDQRLIDEDIIESVWEETEMFLQRSSRLGPNYMLLMAFSGALAAAGLSTGVLHLVLAAMLVIPGFAPIVNIPLGLVLRKSWLIRMGIRSTLWGYVIFAAASALTFHALQLFGDTNIPAFASMPMVHYWTSFSPTTIVVLTVAAAAGITIVPTHRSVLTAGVMVALSLVPGAAILGISLSGGLWEFALRGFLQWFANVLAILVTGLIIFSLKNRLIHKREPWH